MILNEELGKALRPCEVGCWRATEGSFSNVRTFSNTLQANRPRVGVPRKRECAPMDSIAG
jgi:hypothetical protein